MKTYTINNAVTENEMLLIGDYYVEKKVLQEVYNEAKTDILTKQRRDARKIQKERDEKCAADRMERNYFCNQKKLGVAWILLVIILAVIICDPVCVVLSIFGIGMIFTKKMIIVNDYYWTHGGEDQWKF